MKSNERMTHIPAVFATMVPLEKAAFQEDAVARSEGRWTSGDEAFDFRLSDLLATVDNPAKRMQAKTTLRFRVRYPLTRPKQIVLKHDDGTGWSRGQFADAVRAAYHTIYAEEGPDPGLLLGTLNRATSNGPWGIWGHALDDLYLTEAIRQRDGVWALIVES